jgi:hypothetical protein
MSDTPEIFVGLKAIVQYRYKSGGHGWIPMAAFDIVDIAHEYAKKCSELVRPWIYRVAEITDEGVIYHPEVKQPHNEERHS